MTSKSVLTCILRKCKSFGTLRDFEFSLPVDGLESLTLRLPKRVVLHLTRRTSSGNQSFSLRRRSRKRR